MKYLQLAAGGLAAMLACVTGALAQPPQDGPAAPLAGDPEAGAALYETSCEACHANGIGPTLRGVVGRPVASAADFAGYTDALKAKAAETWTLTSLDIFFTDAQAYVPGTAMTVIMSNAQERADVIAYLASLPPPAQ